MAYERWQKPGAKKIEIKKALLECGATDPFGDIKAFVPEDRDEHLNLWVNANNCMRKDGFLEKPGLESSICSSFSYLPACQTNPVISGRNSKRRLESKFCKTYQKADVCQP